MYQARKMIEKIKYNANKKCKKEKDFFINFKIFRSSMYWNFLLLFFFLFSRNSPEINSKYLLKEKNQVPLDKYIINFFDQNYESLKNEFCSNNFEKFQLIFQDEYFNPLLILTNLIKYESEILIARTDYNMEEPLILKIPKFLIDINNKKIFIDLMKIREFTLFLENILRIFYKYRVEIYKNNILETLKYYIWDFLNNPNFFLIVESISDLEVEFNSDNGLFIDNIINMLINKHNFFNNLEKNENFSKFFEVYRNKKYNKYFYELLYKKMDTSTSNFFFEDSFEKYIIQRFICVIFEDGKNNDYKRIEDIFIEKFEFFFKSNTNISPAIKWFSYLINNNEKFISYLNQKNTSCIIKIFIEKIYDNETKEDYSKIKEEFEGIIFNNFDEILNIYTGYKIFEIIFRYSENSYFFMNNFYNYLSSNKNFIKFLKQRKTSYFLEIFIEKIYNNKSKEDYSSIKKDLEDMIFNNLDEMLFETSVGIYCIQKVIKYNDNSYFFQDKFFKSISTNNNFIKYLKIKSSFLIDKYIEKIYDNESKEDYSTIKKDLEDMIFNNLDEMLFETSVGIYCIQKVIKYNDNSYFFLDKFFNFITFNNKFIKYLYNKKSSHLIERFIEKIYDNETKQYFFPIKKKIESMIIHNFNKIIDTTVGFYSVIKIFKYNENDTSFIFNIINIITKSNKTFENYLFRNKMYKKILYQIIYIIYNENFLHFHKESRENLQKFISKNFWFYQNNNEFLNFLNQILYHEFNLIRDSKINNKESLLINLHPNISRINIGLSQNKIKKDFIFEYIKKYLQIKRY